MPERGQYNVATVKVIVTSGTQQVTAIDQAQSQSGMRLMYANPADAFVEVGETGGEEDASVEKKEHKYKPMRIKAYNGQGQEIFTGSDVTTPTLRIDTHAWPAGLYQVTIERNGKTTRHQLSVQH